MEPLHVDTELVFGGKQASTKVYNVRGEDLSLDTNGFELLEQETSLTTEHFLAKDEG